MKHQRYYHLLRRGVEIVLARLRFKVNWQAWLGHWLLGQLNQVGARLIYEAACAKELEATKS